ncbi:hypothetical protein GQ53DRAFT_526301 [Thozetella sp. PMI_491]|nr:hypothetical protein GQ53DRAFT_526301 [Thozetella sp. PMI_491]
MEPGLASLGRRPDCQRFKWYPDGAGQNKRSVSGGRMASPEPAACPKPAPYCTYLPYLGLPKPAPGHAAVHSSFLNPGPPLPLKCSAAHGHGCSSVACFSCSRVPVHCREGLGEHPIDCPASAVRADRCMNGAGVRVWPAILP